MYSVVDRFLVIVLFGSFPRNYEPVNCIRVYGVYFKQRSELERGQKNGEMQ